MGGRRDGRTIVSGNRHPERGSANAMDVMHIDLPVIAGIISTIIFAFSTLPMLLKAFRTKDLRSYSLGNIALANTGNAVHCLYVYSLPPGPIWLLHGFYVVTTALMLAWYLRYEWWPRRRPAQAAPSALDAASA
jgi:uncharacterized protein with PQ loop repeat